MATLVPGTVDVFRLEPGEAPSRCPRCGDDMSIPTKGRQAKTQAFWFRMCLERPRCGITTITEEPPAYVTETVRPQVYRPASLPLQPEELEP